MQGNLLSEDKQMAVVLFYKEVRVVNTFVCVNISFIALTVVCKYGSLSPSSTDGELGQLLHSQIQARDSYARSYVLFLFFFLC